MRAPTTDPDSGLSLLEELEWRGLLHQTTSNRDEVERHLSVPGRVGYCGFDPTRDTLTIGNLLPIKLLMHWQRCGHRPIVLMGGGTGLIGDPSGKDSERQLIDRDQISANVAGQRRIMERLLDFGQSAQGGALLLNNADWLEPLSFIAMLRDVGKHFSVNAMLQRDSVRARLQEREQGISYTEFSYMLLQAYDFLHLKQAYDCTAQLAGSDQYGNIAAGVELIHHKLGRSEEHGAAFGITAPLLLGSDGKKIGKSERGAVFLSADRTSPYAFYQYWINVEDTDVASFLRWFTFMRRDEVEALLAKHATAPEQRLAQRTLAAEMTRLIHGDDEFARAETAAQALFGGDVRSLDATMLSEVFADVPHSTHARDALGGSGVSLVDIVVETALASSKSQARQLLQSGAVSVNGLKVAPDHRLTMSDLLHGDRILLRRGKKQWHATRWS